MIGQSVGPFRVLEKLGAGGMGEVYLAEDTRLGRKVALKRPAESWLRDPDARARLQREARAAARLNDPRIAAVYDVLDLNDRPYIVMEYVEGDTLATYLRRGPIPVERALALGIELTDALEAAHAAGVIHRDLKPGNIVLTASGGVKILDFGLAKTLKERRDDDSAARLTHPGQVLGTPGYVSPEQLLGKPVDVRCDIYSVGAILYEMLTGRAPFEQGDSMGRALASLVEHVPTANQVKPSVPVTVSSVVERAMARNPDHRYQTAADLRFALEQVAGSLGETPTRLVNAPEPPRRRVRETLQVVAAVVLLLAVAGMPLSRWWKTRTPIDAAVASVKRPIIAVLPFENLTGDPALGYVAAGMADTTSTTLAGLSNISVIARSQINEALEEAKDAASICRALGATFVVSGAVHKAGSRLKVTLNVVRPDGRIESGGIVEDEYENLFALQRRLAEDLSGRLLGGISERDRAQLSQPPTSSVTALESYWRARELIDNPTRPGAVDSAIEQFREAIRADPQFALAHAGLGDALWLKYREKTRNTEDARAAVAAIEKARAVDADDPRVRISLARSYEGTGRLDDAVRELQAAIARQPNNDDAHRLLGDIYARQRRDEGAISAYQRAIAIRPQYWQNHAALGRFYFNRGRFAEAAIEFQRVTELQPDNSWAFSNLGAAYHATGDLARAMENYKRAIALAPSEFAYSNLGALYHVQGRYDDAIAAYQAAIKLTPSEPLLFRNLGDARRRKGDEPAARRAYERAIALARKILAFNANDARALSLVAVCEAKLARFDEARRTAARALRLAPQDGRVLHRIAVVYALAGDSAEALAFSERAVRNGASRTMVRDDEDLEALRHDPRFLRLTSEGN